MELFICPVCGYDKLTEKPYDDVGCPSHEICSCCGFEFGFDDAEINAIENYRQNWIESGFNFFNKDEKELNWNTESMLVQLKNIKDFFNERNK